MFTPCPNETIPKKVRNFIHDTILLPAWSQPDEYFNAEIPVPILVKENEISSNKRNSSTCSVLQKSNFEKKILRECIKSGITQQYGDNHPADEYANVCGISVHIKSLLQKRKIRKLLAPFVEKGIIYPSCKSKELEEIRKLVAPFIEKKIVYPSYESKGEKERNLVAPFIEEVIIHPSFKPGEKGGIRNLVPSLSEEEMIHPSCKPEGVTMNTNGISNSSKEIKRIRTISARTKIISTKSSVESNSSKRVEILDLTNSDDEMDVTNEVKVEEVVAVQNKKEDTGLPNSSNNVNVVREKNPLFSEYSTRNEDENIFLVSKDETAENISPEVSSANFRETIQFDNSDDWYYLKLQSKEEVLKEPSPETPENKTVDKIINCQSSKKSPTKRKLLGKIVKRINRQNSINTRNANHHTSENSASKSVDSRQLKLKWKKRQSLKRRKRKIKIRKNQASDNGNSETSNLEIPDADIKQRPQGNSSSEDVVKTNKKIEIQKIPVFKEECHSPSRNENNDISYDNCEKYDCTIQEEETEECSGEDFKENKRHENVDFAVQGETEKCSRTDFKENERERDKPKRNENDTFNNLNVLENSDEEETMNSQLKKRSSRRARCLGACVHCGKKFGQNLKQHEMQCNMMPTGGIYHKCALCRFKTKIKNDFKEHLSGHIFGSHPSETMDVAKSMNESVESCNSLIDSEVSISQLMTKTSEKRSVNINSALETEVCDKKTVSNVSYSTQVYNEMSSLSSNSICKTTILDETIPPQVSIEKTYLQTKNAKSKRSRKKRIGLNTTQLTKSCSTPFIRESIESYNPSIASEIPNGELNELALKNVTKSQDFDSTFETKVRNKRNVSDELCLTQVSNEIVLSPSSNIVYEPKTFDKTIESKTTITKSQNETLKRKIISKDISETHNMQVCNGAVPRQVPNAPYVTRVPITTIAEAFNITLETEDCDASHLGKCQNEITSQASCTPEIELSDNEDESEKSIISDQTFSRRAIDQDNCNITTQTTYSDQVIKLKEFDTTQVFNSAAFDEKCHKRKENVTREKIVSNSNQDIQVIKEIPKTSPKSSKQGKKLSPNMFMKARCWSCNINMSVEQRKTRCFRCFKKLTYWCTMCNKEFDSHNAVGILRNHVLTSLQTPLDQLKCPKCPKSFLALCKLKRHESMCFEHLNVRFDKIPYLQLERCDSLVKFYKDKRMKIENRYKIFEPHMPGDSICSDEENSSQWWQSDYRKEKGRTDNCKTNWKKQFYPVHGKVYKQQSEEDNIQNQFDINFESTFSLKESFEIPKSMTNVLLEEKIREPVIDQVFSIQTDPTYFDMINGDDILNCDSLLIGKCSAQKVINDVSESIVLTSSQVDADTDLVMMNNVNNVENEVPSTSYCTLAERNSVVNNTFWSDGVFNYSNEETTIENLFSVSKLSASCSRDDKDLALNRTVNNDAVLQVQRQEQVESSETLVEDQPFVEETSIFKQWIEESSEKEDVINDMVYASFVKNLNESVCKSTSSVANIQPTTDFAEKIDQRIGVIGTTNQDLTHVDLAIGTSFSNIPLSSGFPEVKMVNKVESPNDSSEKPLLNRFEPRKFTLGYCQKCDAYRNDSTQKIKWKRYKEFCKICKNILSYQCARCDEKFISIPVIFKHLKNNCVPLKRHHCTLCDYSTVYSKRDVQLHMQRKHGNDCVNCFYCNKSFKCVEDCKAHLKSCNIKVKGEYNLSHKQDAETEDPKLNVNQYQKTIIDYSKLELGQFKEHKEENLELHSQHSGKNIETRKLEVGQHDRNKEEIPKIYPKLSVEKEEQESKLAFESDQEVFGIEKPGQCTSSSRLLQNSDYDLKQHHRKRIRKAKLESLSSHVMGKKKITKPHLNQREGYAITRKVPANHLRNKYSTKISQSTLPVRVECSSCNLSTDKIEMKKRCGKCRNSLKYRCTICNKVFKNYFNFRGHYAGSHRRSKIDKPQAITNKTLQASQSPNCVVVTNDQEKLALEVAENYKPILYKCCQCDAQFSSQAGLKDHNNNHCSKITMQSCTQCDFKAHSKTDLNMHMRSQHTDEKLDIRCQKCQRGFSGLGALNRHLKQCN